jgi:hypothetical protein
MPGGRPTLYKPEYCQQVIDTLKDGNSLAHFASDIGICRDTLTNWQRDKPEFFAACKEGQLGAQKFWEAMLRRCAIGLPIKIDGKEYKNYNITAMIFLMKARFDEYKEGYNVGTTEMPHNQLASLRMPAVASQPETDSSLREQD